ncbi:MAG: hypothetical protein M3315_05830 [Actinomycetota bacterium]|nr:hypothetical protein [Actinomycetota bacterium]
MDWFLSQPVQLQAALIGAVAALVVVLLRDVGSRLLFDVLARFFFEWRGERSERRKAALAVYSTYADPLASAATSLFWRLREVFYEPHRATFLRQPEPSTELQRYKKVSTLYRLAALLGWIRGFRRELSFFTVDDRTRLRTLEDAINQFESALADGRGVEVQRVEGLAELWGFKLPDDDQRKSTLSVKVEAEIKNRFAVFELWDIRERPESQKLEICAVAGEVLAQELREDLVRREAIDENLSQAVEILGVREAWLWRDWQAAIGDLMLEEVSAGRRRFEVKGYVRFLEMREKDGPERDWMELLAKVMQGVDISRSDGSDARVLQLKGALAATAKILIALSQVKERPGSVPTQTLKEARQVLKAFCKLSSAPRKTR